MKRLKYSELIKWKSSPKRKPLILEGARQVGKTFLVNQFAKNEYSDLVYLNFEHNPKLKTLFEESLDPHTILRNINLLSGKKAEENKSLIFFDEIQVLPTVLTSLKYFYEQAPEYHIIAAGSLLGVSINKQDGFPVGKVNFMRLYPMNFAEFLLARGNELLLNELDNKDDFYAIPEALHDKLNRELKMYLFLGGMPEVVQDYINNSDIVSAREIQKDILMAYQHDFSKYTSKSQALKTTEFWKSVPYQLSKENKKFKYKDVKKNARASTYEQTIEYLNSAGLINISYNVSTPKIPLSAYADYSKFKVFMLDTGLLGAMLDVSSEIILQPTAIFSEYNGAFIESFVASELKAANHEALYYWTSKSEAELDFILQYNNTIIPLEVKSGMSRKLKSLKSYTDKYSPDLAIRISPRNFSSANSFVNIPLYSVFAIFNYLKLFKSN
jgi:predicted AAA+ superfamily ATPase